MFVKKIGVDLGTSNIVIAEAMLTFFIKQVLGPLKIVKPKLMIGVPSVSYTHLTLPTKRIV